MEIFKRWINCNKETPNFYIEKSGNLGLRILMAESAIINMSIKLNGLAKGSQRVQSWLIQEIRRQQLKDGKIYETTAFRPLSENCKLYPEPKRSPASKEPR